MAVGTLVPAGVQQAKIRPAPARLPGETILI